MRKRLGLLAIACGTVAPAMAGLPARASSTPSGIALYSVKVASQTGAYPLDSGSPSFDARNTAYFRDGKYFTIVAPGKSAQVTDFGVIASIAINRDIFNGKEKWDGKWDSGWEVDTAVRVDDAGRLYTLVIPRYSNLKTAVLLWSTDKATTWHAFALTGRDAMMEIRDGFNDMSGPPTVVSFDAYGALTGPHLWLEPLTMAGGMVVRTAPAALVSNRSLLFPKHSGCSNSTFTTRDKIFVVYPVTGPAGFGTAEFGRQYNRLTHQFEGGEVPLGRSLTPKGPDPHDEPGITADGQGFLSVVLPGHQVMMQMIRSRQPNSMLDGWSAPQLVGQPSANNLYGHYTYPTLTTSRDGTINIVVRAEGNGYFFRLVQLQKKANANWKVWSSGTVERAIVVPNRRYYVAWRQRMTMAPSGTLYLNFRYFPDDLTAREIASYGLSGKKPDSCSANGRCWFNAAPTLAPLTIWSSDEGQSWHRAPA